MCFEFQDGCVLFQLCLFNSGVERKEGEETSYSEL